MIDRLAGSMALFCAQKGIFAPELADEYTYGYKLLLSSLFNLAVILIVGLVLQMVAEAIVFTAAFAILRTIAGGFHARSHKMCIITFASVFLIFALLVNRLTMAYVPAILSLTLMSSIIVLLKAPVAAKNKPLSVKKRVKLRKTCIVFVGSNIAVSLVVSIFSALQFLVAIAYFSGIFAASLSLFAAGVIKMEGTQND